MYSLQGLEQYDDVLSPLPPVQPAGREKNRPFRDKGLNALSSSCTSFNSPLKNPRLKSAIYLHGNSWKTAAPRWLSLMTQLPLLALAPPFLCSAHQPPHPTPGASCSASKSVTGYAAVGLKSYEACRLRSRACTFCHLAHLRWRFFILSLW